MRKLGSNDKSTADIEVSAGLTVGDTGKVIGDVIVGTIVMDEGAQLEGTCRMRRQSSQEALLSKSIEI